MPYINLQSSKPPLGPMQYATIAIPKIWKDVLASLPVLASSLLGTEILPILWNQSIDGYVFGNEMI